MFRLLTIVLALFTSYSFGQSSKESEDELLGKILADPSAQECESVLSGLRRTDLSPRGVMIHDTINLSNSNRLLVVSHIIEGNRHYGAVVVPKEMSGNLPLVIFATGGDGMHSQFDITQDFGHKAVQYPNFIGGGLDTHFIVVIPSFRGQQLIIGNRKYQSEGKVGDAFVGATTDALGFLNVVIHIFNNADTRRISIIGGSRGGAVALLAAERDRRIKKVVAIAAPTDMKKLYLLYPDQFKLLFFNDLLAGNISFDDARKKFIAGSPVYFSHALPAVQIHHDSNDPFVPVSFANDLIEKVKQEGGDITPFFYSEGIHGFWEDPAFWKRVQDFIR